ncbi:MAG: class I SAM-dependent methyltransferase [Gloeobacteraceae cyanobacterium ES-bin-144]|nr:class I SAM-dependent methyltransferase [Verrucomicrobiales bacterium]
MNPSLETLMLAFSQEDGLAIPRRALFIGAEPHEALGLWPEIVGWQPLKPLADAWDRAGLRRLEKPTDATWPTVLVLPGKSHDETLAWFAMARKRLALGGRLIAAMPNTAGAGRFEKELARVTGNLVSLQKHKCRAFHALDDGNWDEARFQEWHLLGEPREISGTSFTVQAGVFSSDHIDPGSQLLVDHLPASLRGVVADLGAGWGFLSDAALHRCPRIERIDLFEADTRALDCARRNLAHHTREIHFHWHDVTTGLPEKYDTILMNPPFHTGQATNIDLGRAFLKTAIYSLKRGGKMLLVANRQLPYEAVLEASGLAWRKTAENSTYKILSADKR